ncbi:mitotubule-associated protein Gb4, partial [Trypanosoma rangeli]
VDEGRVRGVVLKPEADGLLVEFELRRPASLTEQDGTAAMDVCKYKAVWAVYQEVLLGMEEKVVTTHKLGFEGEDWDYVLERRDAEVKEAAAIETARALGVGREDVVEVGLTLCRRASSCSSRYVTRQS